jgi:hypothetical protein
MKRSTPQVRNPSPGGHAARDDAAAVACSIVKGIHRWADPFNDGDTCACGALFLYAHPRGSAVFEVHDQ